MVTKWRYVSRVERFIKDFDKHELAKRKKAAKLVRKKIKRKALKMKRTGTLAKGVYDFHNSESSFVGIHAPAYHNYLVEFGHRDSHTGKYIPGTPIVYPTFEESTNDIMNILNEQMEDYK